MEEEFSEQIKSILRKPTATVDEFRAVIGCSRRAAYDFVKQGRIRSLTMGRRILIPTSAIRAMLEGDAA